MARHQYISWFYTGSKPKRDYLDPRLPVARHIGWQRGGNITQFSVPEPDNYNRAVITDTAVECRAIEDQVIYRDHNKLAWVCLLYVPEHQLSEYDVWLQRIQPLAHWQHTKAPKIREHFDRLA